jgi:hypothetical protein
VGTNTSRNRGGTCAATSGAVDDLEQLDLPPALSHAVLRARGRDLVAGRLDA